VILQGASENKKSSYLGLILHCIVKGYICRKEKKNEEELEKDLIDLSKLVSNSF
jgi:hypothetical protein